MSIYDFIPLCDSWDGRVAMQLGVLLSAHVQPELRVCLSMLTSPYFTRHLDPDVAVVARAPAPGAEESGPELVAFHVMTKIDLAYEAAKARRFVTDGVRRVFLVEIPGHTAARVYEWQAPYDRWQPLDHAAAITDAAFITPVAIAAIIDALGRDGSGELKPFRTGVPAELAAELELRRAELTAPAVIAILEARHIAVADAQRAEILADRDLARIHRRFEAAQHCADIATLLA